MQDMNKGRGNTLPLFELKKVLEIIGNEII